MTKQYKLQSMWLVCIGSLRKWLVKLLMKAPAMSGLLTLMVSQIQKRLVANCRRNAEASMKLTNPQDPFAAAVIKVGCVVGHVPRTVIRRVSFFLGKNGSFSFCEVTGALVNCAAGFGLEISCMHQFYGHQAYIERRKNLLL